MHLKKLGLTYSACEPFTKIIKEVKNLNKLGMQNIFREILQT